VQPSARIVSALLVAVLLPTSLAARQPPPGPCPSYTSSLSLNTGEETGSPLAPGSSDPFWTVISDPFASTVEPRPANVLTDPNSAWKTIPNTQWIGSQSSSTQDTNGFYDYQFCFCLRDGFQKPNLQLTFRADDKADVYLNNTLAQIQSGSAVPILHGAVSSFGNPTPDTLPPVNPALFKFGKNCLIVHVQNTSSVATGLDVAGTISASAPGGSSGGGLLNPQCCDATGSLCGMKYNDLNHDGIHQAAEPGLPGWTIQLSNGQTAVTDQFGDYCFSNLQPGTYTLTEQPQAGWVQTSPKAPPSYSATVTPATAVGGLDFGNFQGQSACSLTGNIVSGCCLGPVPCPGAAAPSNFYSFLASVTLAGTASCTLTVTSNTTGLVIGSYGPTTLQAGANFVTGTFSAPQTSSPFTLKLSCTSGTAVLCSTALTAPLPTCQTVPGPPPAGIR
jgi:hypothetical protein